MKYMDLISGIGDWLWQNIWFDLWATTEGWLFSFYDLCTIIENQPFFEYTLFINRPVYMAKDGMR